MASTINASSTSTSGLIQTADATGILQLQSNGVTGLTVDTAANVTVNTNLTFSNKIQQANLPTGCVLQVVQAVKTDTFVGAANLTEMLVTGVAATITPRFANSKILITAQIMYGSTGTTYGGWFKRNGTNIGLGDAAGSRQRVSIGMALSSDTNQTNTFVYNYLDSPATTSAVTYQFYVNNDNTQNLFINRSVNDLDNGTGKRGISTVTLMEIAG